MTLSTNIYALDEVSPHELFRFCQTLLTQFDDERRPWNEQRCSDRPDSHFVGRDADDKPIWERDPKGSWSIANDLGQGLPAILDISYRPGAPLRTPEQAAECEEGYCEPDCDKDHYYRACWLDVDFDTSYTYRDSRGWGCGDLHAALVTAVGAWLDERGVQWEWRNEFTGETHGGEDRYERLAELGKGGADAAEWMRTAVLPAIAAEVLAAPRGEESDR